MKLKIFLFFFSAPLLADDIDLNNLESAPADPSAPSEWVYIQQSKVGTLKEAGDDYYILTLVNNHLEVIYFADQPNRFTGREDLSSFFKAWQRNEIYHEKPPTAFINYTFFEASTDKGVTPDILELNNPKYNLETDTLTFEVKPLHEHPIKQGKFKNVVIIYDKE